MDNGVIIMKMRKIKMDDYELKIIINSLNVTRTKLINENKMLKL